MSVEGNEEDTRRRGLDSGEAAMKSGNAPVNLACYPSFAQAAVVLVLLIFATLIAYVDRQVMALLVAPLKAAFALSDTRFGLLQGVALNLCFGLAMLPLGFIVDRHNRVRLICISALGWSLFTAMSGLCTEFGQLFACRMGVGIAEAALAPAAYSLIADLYPANSRATATLVFYGGVSLAASAGIALSGALIGFITSHSRVLWMGWGQIPVWRLTFFAAAVPGVLIAVLFCGTSEPTRKVHDDESREPAPQVNLGEFLRTHWIAVFGLLGGLAASVAGIGTLLMWMPTILDRNFGLPAAQAGKGLGLIFGVASLGGVTIAGGLSAGLRRRWGALAPLQVLRFGSLISAMALPGLIWAHSADQMLAISLVYFVFGFVAQAVGPALMIAIAPNGLRGRLIAIYGLIDVTAAAFWPMLIGSLSDRVFHGRQGLLLALCAVIVPCGFVGFFSLVFVGGPLRRMVAVPTVLTHQDPMMDDSMVTARPSLDGADQRRSY